LRAEILALLNGARPYLSARIAVRSRAGDEELDVSSMSRATIPADPESVPMPVVPGSFRVGTQLMQDAVTAEGVSVGEGRYNQEALFANPFKDGREEALIINIGNELTYLARTDDPGTGWAQAPVQAAGKATFAEVVVAVHPNRTVWAFCLPSGSATAPQVFLLTKTGEKPDGTALCAWVAAPGPVSANALPAMSSLCVSYTQGSVPVVLGRGGGGGLSCVAVSAIAPNAAQPTFAWSWVQGPAINEDGRIVGGGYVPNVHQPQAVEGSYIYYVLTGTTLTRRSFYTSYTAGQPYGAAQVSTSVKSFCGTWNVPDLPQGHPQGDTGYIYLDSNGDLVAGYWVQYSDHGQQQEQRTGGLGLATASSWQDTDGLLHVFALDGDRTLRVLHQSGWQAAVSPPNDFPVFPAWTSAVVAGAPAGIGGFGLMNAADRLVAFDFTGSGKSDRLLGYKPPLSASDPEAVLVLSHDLDGSFHTEFALPPDEVWPGSSTVALHREDTASDSTGGDNYVLVTRLAGDGANAWALYKGAQQSDGSYELRNTRFGLYLVPQPVPFQQTDQVMAFDYTRSGKNDHLLVYRPGASTAWVLAPSQSSPYTIVVTSTTGLGSFDLKNTADRVIGLDYNSSGSLTHLLAYRPGARTAYILAPDDQGGFTTVLDSSNGIGGYDLAVPEDRLVAFDYTGEGCNDHILAYRPGTNPRHGDQTAWVLERVPDTNTYRSLTPPSSRYGLGGYDFASPDDLVTGLDYSDTGGLCYLVAYRPGAGKVSVMGQRGANNIAPVYQAPPAPVIPVTVGLHAGVAGFQLDPYPDYKPSEIIKMRDMTPAEAYCICTQDVTTSGWQTDKVRLPDPDPKNPPPPYIVSHYVANVTLVSGEGSPMAGHNVTVSASSLVETQIGGVSYQVGPGRAISVATSATGSFVVSIAARGLNPPVIHLNADGLRSGAAIDFAVQANDFLAGKGSLPSQAGAFTPDLLENATITPNTASLDEPPPKLANWTALKERGLTPQVVVDHCTNMYGQAAGGSQLQPALIEGYDEPQPVIGYVIQLWDPDRPAYQPFRSQSELDAYKAYRSTHPAYGGWWDDFTSWASDVWEGIKTGAAKVAEVIVSTVTEIAVWVGNAIVSLGELIIDAIEQAVQAVEAVFQMIADAITRVIDWLKSLFAFGDIWDTKTALQSGFETIVSYGLAEIDAFGEPAHGWFASKAAQVSSLFEELKATLGGKRLGDFQNEVPPVADPAGQPVDKSGLQSNPQANWMMNKVAGQDISTHGSPAFTLFPADSPVPGAFEALIQALSQSGISDELTRAAGDVEILFSNLLDPDGGAQGSSVVAVLDLVERLILAIIEALDNLTQHVFTFLGETATSLVGTLNTPMNIPIITALYEWIRPDDASKDPMRLSDLVFLILGFFVTTIYKLINGVDNAPFPGGAFPPIPAPPSHPDYDPDFQVTDPADYNHTLAIVQIACGSCGIVGSFAEMLADAAPITPGLKANGAVAQMVLSGIQLISSTIMFGVVSNCPPISGEAWNSKATGPFTMCTIMAVLQGGALGYSVASQLDPEKYPPESAIFKNISGNRGLVGTTITSIISFGFMTQFCIDTSANPYSFAQSVIQFIPGMLQFIRWDTGNPEDESYAWRLWGVGIADLLCNLTPSIMTIIGATTSAFTQRVAIPSQGFTTGAVGMWYSEPISYTNATATYNSPPQNWAVAGGGLPPGLVITPGGHIQGVPTAATNSTPASFSLSCTDSYGPPQYSDDSPSLGISINSTSVGSVQFTSANTIEMPISSTIPAPLTVKVLDTSQNPLTGAGVLITLPSPGVPGTAAATFAPGTANVIANEDGSTSVIVVTEPGGTVSVPSVWANTATGSYTVTASVPGVPAATATCTITNTECLVKTMKPGTGATPQTAAGPAYALSMFRIAGHAFPYQFTATLTDASGKAVPNMIVTFSVPGVADGSYGSFVNNGGSAITVVSDGSGNANAGSFTNDTGSGNGLNTDFTITATIAGANVTTTYSLTNA
jgi:hypothetical protein